MEELRELYRAYSHYTPLRTQKIAQHARQEQLVEQVIGLPCARDQTVHFLQALHRHMLADGRQLMTAPLCQMTSSSEQSLQRREQWLDALQHVVQFRSCTALDRVSAEMNTQTQAMNSTSKIG